jgi:hypothetical protein
MVISKDDQRLGSRSDEVDFIDNHRTRRASNEVLAKRVGGPSFIGSRLLSVQLLWNECVKIVQVRSHLDGTIRGNGDYKQ